MKEYLPGTQARRDRLFRAILTKEVGDRDGLAMVQWEDGSMTLKSVIWESDLSAIMDPDSGDMWFARGRGGEAKDWNGIPVWFVYAGNAGVISTEASLIADAERFGDVVDVGAGDEVPDELFELGVEDPNGGRSHEDQSDSGGTDPGSGAQASPTPRTDGGVPDVEDDAAIYDLRPPEQSDGVAIDVRDPDDFDPFPVTRSDAKAAAEWFEQSADDGTDTWMKGFLVGIVVSVVLAAIFMGGPWILTEVVGGGGSGGGGTDGGGTTVTGTLLFLAACRPAARAHASALADHSHTSLEVLQWRA